MPINAFLNFNSYMIVGIFGFFGVTLRFWLDQYFHHRTAPFWLSTLLINVAGSFLLGFFTEFSHLKQPSIENLRLGFIIGLCGGFTTFSTYSMNMLRLLLEGNVFGSLAYGSMSLFAGVGAAYLGICLGRVV